MPKDSQHSKEDKLVTAMANMGMALGLQPPTYKKPHWYNFRLKRKLAYYDARNWPYRVEQDSERVF